MSSQQDSAGYWLDTLGAAQPLYATQPTPGAKNELAIVERVAQELGTPLLPWQKYVVRVATEKNPDGSYRYGTIVLTVPRQSGKSLLIRTVLTARALTNPKRKAFATAQTGKDAQERWRDLIDAISASKFGNTIHVRRAADSPRITFHNGSRIAPFVPNAESLHGYTFADLVLDEVFCFDELLGNDILGAAIPAMQTVTARQTWLISTKGTPKSTFLNSWLKRGRLALQEESPAVAIFEWALPNGVDASDASLWDFHPGLHGGLITKDDIAQAQGQMSRGEWERSYMNRETITVESVLDTKKWAQSYATLGTPQRRSVGIGWEVAYDKSSAAIVAAFKEGEFIQIKVLRTGAGIGWLPDALKQVKDSYPLDITADKYPMNQMITDAFYADNYGAELRLLKADEYKTAGVSFKSLLEDGRLQHDGHIALRDAISSAATRRMGEGWVFSHERSEPALIAAVAAVRMVTEQRAYEAPMVLFAD
ncbi:phage terminase family protein [Arthrobacter sp. CJ23]|uniref:phage terminase family protein n=1 Tax=Arthrobacter sp. CJ23 TaxID=2972479 RepID=UPI00215D0216|nr:phage terminase family protein [Arthrobacter sp. CJ23]UVJ37978.1 phage terminase family protein [Arthrobacter sp. CJ23]